MKAGTGMGNMSHILWYSFFLESANSKHTLICLSSLSWKLKENVPTVAMIQPTKEKCDFQPWLLCWYICVPSNPSCSRPKSLKLLIPRKYILPPQSKVGQAEFQIQASVVVAFSSVDDSALFPQY